MAAAPIGDGLLRPRARQRPSGRLRLWAMRIAAVAMLAAGAWWLRGLLLGDGAHPKAHVQRVRLVSAPKSAPRPPDRVPEPTRGPERAPDLRLEAQPATPEARPPGLGVDSDAEGSGGGFGLEARRGGQDITTLGSGDVAGEATRASIARLGNRMVFSAYAGTVVQRLRSELQGDDALTAHDYVALLELWIDGRGRIERAELPGSTGSPATDSALRDALARVAGLPPPPAGLPQPLRVRVSAREINAAGR